MIEIACGMTATVTSKTQKIYATVINSLYGVVALVLAIGLVLSCVALRAYILQLRRKASSSNISGLVILLSCIFNIIVSECKIGRVLYWLYEERADVTPFSHLDAVSLCGRATQNLLVTVQSFERYIIICKPHLKEDLTISKQLSIDYSGGMFDTRHSQKFFTLPCRGRV